MWEQNKQVRNQSRRQNNRPSRFHFTFLIFPLIALFSCTSEKKTHTVQSGYFLIFGCCFDDSVIVTNAGNVIFSQVIKTDANTGTVDNALLKLVSYNNHVSLSVILFNSKRPLDLTLPVVQTNKYIFLSLTDLNFSYQISDQPVRGQ